MAKNSSKGAGKKVDNKPGDQPDDRPDPLRNLKKFQKTGRLATAIPGTSPSIYATGFIPLLASSFPLPG